MKNLKRFTIIFLLLTIVIACHKDDPIITPVAPDCGCDSPAKNTLIDKVGELKYDAIKNRKYVVFTYGNIQLIDYICSENILIANNISAVDILVKISGNEKTSCYPPQAGSGDSLFAEITLTQIQQL
jgi:hypothetical protein